MANVMVLTLAPPSRHPTESFGLSTSDLPHNARAALVADAALAGLCFMFVGEFNRSNENALNWVTGSGAERAIGSKLTLR